MGAHLLSTHAYSHRNFYNSKFPNAAHTCQTTKKQAFHWYNTWAAFQKVRPHKTYAQALLTNSAKKVVTRDVTNVLPISAIKVQDLKARPHVLHANVHPPHANPAKNNHAHTGKRQRVVPNKLNVPVPLHNRFQVFDNFNAEREAFVQIGIMQRDSNVQTTDTSMVVAGDKRLEKHSQECKHPSLLGVPQPIWVDQQILLSQGIKTKLGLSEWAIFAPSIVQMIPYHRIRLICFVQKTLLV